jgi:uncharacterized coiled-coil DUF342 family protein
VGEQLERRKALQDLWDKVTEFIAKADQRNIQTDEWRAEVKCELKEMNNKITALPCKERSNGYNNMREVLNGEVKSIYRNLGWLWALLCAFIIAVVGYELKK